MLLAFAKFPIEASTSSKGNEGVSCLPAGVDNIVLLAYNFKESHEGNSYKPYSSRCPKRNYAVNHPSRFGES